MAHAHCVVMAHTGMPCHAMHMRAGWLHLPYTSGWTSAMWSAVLVALRSTVT